MSNEGSKGLLDQAVVGTLNLLDSVRHSFEQAAWGQETSGNLTDDFYRWIGPAEDAPRPIQAAELGGGVEVTVEVEPFTPGERDWQEFAAWIDGKLEARAEPQLLIEHERSGPSREGPELGD